jgi:hypothetical protein
VIKEPVHGRVTGNQEFTMMRHHERKVAPKRARALHPDLIKGAPATVRMLLPDRPGLAALVTDTPGDAEGNGMIGAGVPRAKMSDQQVKDAMAALREMLSLSGPVDGWEEGFEREAAYTMYARMDVRGKEVVQSELYTRNRTRVSHHVLCAYEELWCEPEELQYYIATVRFFVKAVMPPCEDGALLPPMRYAVASLSPATLVEVGVYNTRMRLGYGKCWKTVLCDPSVPHYAATYAVLPERMSCKRYSLLREPEEGEQQLQDGVPDDEADGGN